MSSIATTTKIGSMTVTTINPVLWAKSMELAGGDRKRLVLTMDAIIVANSPEHANAIRANIRYGTNAVVVNAAAAKIEAATPPAPAKPASDEVTIGKTMRGKFTREYWLTGTIDGEHSEERLVRTSKTTDYTFASLTSYPATEDGKPQTVLTFHKTQAAAVKGTGSRVRTAVRVIEITEA